MVKTADEVLSDLYSILHAKLGERVKDFLFPPPVFTLMQGELLELDLEKATLTARFPVLESYRNPYGTMQGGMLAAAVDNTIGPLSVAVAPPNVTRTLEMKYSQAVRPEMGYIMVHARLVERMDPKLIFEARVSSPTGAKLAICKATHWIVDAPARR